MQPPERRELRVQEGYVKMGVLEFCDPNIDIELVVQEGQFGPDMVETLSKKWGIPTNLMFIGSPGTHFLYGLAELGGVRLII